MRFIIYVALGFMGKFSISSFLFSLIFLSSAYFTLFRKLYYISDDG